jgi:hypothetical protein
MNAAPISTTIRTGQSVATDTATAVAEFHRQVWQENAQLVVFFSSSRHDADVLTAEMNRRFAGVPVVGCTTAGEIGPAGYLAGSIAGFSLPPAGFAVATGLLADLCNFEVRHGQAFAETLLRSLEERAPQAGPDNSFAFLMVDGLSIREEPVARTIQAELGKIMMFGGSAGDDLKFERTRVFHDGAFRDNAALLVLIHTTLPFHIFKTQHFVCEEERLVVTEADVAHRIVREINGLPAAEEYARLVGTDLAHLNPAHFAASPVVVVVDGTDYVRSIQKVNPDGSLTFYSAIDEGLVFRVARGVGLVDNLRRTLEEIAARIGEPQLLIACDCILRNLELAELGQKEAVGELFKRYHAVGFSTYGEQFGGVHVNQTLTGIIIGR